MKINRGVALVATTAAVALLASGCSSSDSGSADGGDVELRWIMSADSQAEVDVWEHLADMVHEQYPEITVNFESAPFKDYYNKLTTQAASNDLACIAGLQAQRVPDVGSLFTDLEPSFESTDFDIADYAPSIVEGLQNDDGEQLAVPYDLGPYVLYYNKDMFDAAGLPVPTPGWSKEEFLSAAKTLTTDGKYGFAADGTPDTWLPYVLSIGGDYIADGKPDLTNDKVVEGFTWVTDLVTKEQVAPAPPATGASNWTADQWRSGNVAMYVDGPWQLINAKANVDFTVGLATVPATDGTSITTMSGTGFGVTQGCDHPEEAWKAISVIIGADAQKYIADAGRGFPAYLDAQENWYTTAGVDGAQEAIETALSTVNVYRTTPKWNQLSALMLQYGVEAFSGAKTPAEVLEQVQSQVGN
ncbi:sugar ABC transporter substrate-binding protein [Herbiconiux moechotypicola]|uniref:Sugar ABC transporter substrate-binding protein n=1 Tax=Herbiconiux moechotypicola TaxID=637393 RepID=A0ABN3DRR1_9MICO|nr:sugar ABC transporter substrate-binding protein [Herbiconiux moechotypicola]MCS5731703.1 sugar ABC transporter substrate-binding protein [Herbiconiux moechotypicola]